ncbi:hypothetical protein DMENIID0001_053240 [Sergentomyia squamirostris]
MRDRDQANVIWRRSRLAEDHRRFKVLRNNVVTMIRDAKDKYYESQLDPTLDSRTLWRNVNRLGLKGADGDLGHCAQDPDSLNSFFCSSASDSTPSCAYPNSLAPSREFNFIAVSDDQVIYAVSGIKSSAVGIDGFSIDFIKLLLPVILPYLTELLNFSITTSTFPSSWKTAVVTPIPKVASPACPSDFRPINDLQIYCFGDYNDPDCPVEALNDDLGRISQWSLENGLRLNPKKSQALIIHSRFRSPSTSPVFLQDEIIPFSDNVKNLGVIFNSTLTWSDHFSQVSRRVYLGLRTLRRLQSYTPTETRLLLVRALLIPHLTYGMELFFGATQDSLHKLTMVFNSLLRYVYGLRRYDHVSAVSGNILGIPFEEYLRSRAVDFISHLLRSCRPDYLVRLIECGRSDRSSCLLVPRSIGCTFHENIFIKGVVLWNALPIPRKRELIRRFVRARR